MTAPDSRESRPAGVDHGVAAAGAAPPRASQQAPGRMAWVLAGVLLLAISTAAVAIYAYTSRGAGDRDPFIYAQVGKEILAGKRLYSETWIDKPPIALLMYAAPQFFAPRSYQAICVFWGLLIVVQAWLLAYAFRDSLPAAAASSLFILFYPLVDGTLAWPSTEHFANVFVTANLLLALAIVRQGTSSVAQCLAAGALAITAFHVRQNTVLCGLLPILAVSMSAQPPTQRARALLMMVAGGVVAWLAIIVVVVTFANLTDYLWMLVVDPRVFASTGTWDEMWQLSRYFAGNPLALFLVIFTGLAAQGRLFWFSLALAIIGVGGCLLTFHNHPHYFANAVPYVAVLAGLGTQRLAQFGPGLPWLATAAVAISVLPTAYGRMQIVADEPAYLELSAVAAEADSLAPQEATLWVCGPLPSEAIQFASRLPVAHMNHWVMFMRSLWKELLPRPWEIIQQEFLEQPPGVLVVHESLLRQALAPAENGAEPEYLQLLRALLARHRYARVADEKEYAILLRAT